MPHKRCLQSWADRLCTLGTVLKLNEKSDARPSHSERPRSKQVVETIGESDEMHPKCQRVNHLE